MNVDRDELIRLRNQGASWRVIAKTLGIGPATAIRLFKVNGGTCSKTQNTRSKTPDEVE